MRWLLTRFYFAPDEGGSAGGSGGASGSGVSQSGASDAGTAGAVAGPAGAAGTTSGVADSGTTPTASGGSAAEPIPGQATPGGTAAPAPPSWLTNLRDAGIGEFKDEQSAIQALRQLQQAHQQFRQLAPWVQSYQQNAAAFAQFIQQQAQQRQAGSGGGQQGIQPASAFQGQAGQGGTNKPWWAQHWAPPEYNPAWQGMLQLDEQGNIQPKPGTPPEVAAKYLAYKQFREEQMARFTSNPYEFMEPAIKELARQEAQAIVNAQLSQHQDVQRSDQFVQQNSTWLYQRDENGNVMQQMVHNPMTGVMQAMPIMSQWGQLFAQEAQRVAQEQGRRGYSDIEEQKRLAMREVQFQYLLSMQQAQQAQQAGQGQQGAGQSGMGQQGMQQSPGAQARQQANQQFLQQNNPAAPQPARGNQRPAKVPVTRKNMADILRQEFAANGINDSVLNNELMNAVQAAQSIPQPGKR